jgi:hypothetical protein
MNRRDFVRAGTAIAIAGPTLLMTGCSPQATIAVLLSELQTSWASLETDLGKAMPASVTTLFTQAITIVKNWVPGSPAQDAVEALQALSTAIGGIGTILGPLTAIEAAAAQLILGTVVNIIEDIDPASVPPIAGTAAAALKAHAATAGLKVPVAHFTKGSVNPRVLKDTFERQWRDLTGKNAA